MYQEKTIFVVDDDAHICAGLRWLFESVNLKVETYNDGVSYLAKYDPTREGCLLLDIRMPIISGLQLLKKLNPVPSLLPVIVITGYDDSLAAVRAMKAGAVDFILKPINEQQLLEIVYYHLENPSFKDEENNIHSPLSHNLTNREQQVLNLIIDGKYNKEIAFELKISIATVEAHRAKVMRKFNAKNLAQLMKNYYYKLHNNE